MVRRMRRMVDDLQRAVGTSEDKTTLVGWLIVRV